MLRSRFSGGLAGRPAGARGSLSALARSAPIVGALTAVAMLVSAASALAVSGTTIKIGTPYESGPPSVAVDSTGTAYIAWANEKDLAGANDFVEYCVLPSNATGCTHSGSLLPAIEDAHVDGVQVLVDGSTVVVLANVYGGGSKSLEYTPVQEWQSTDGGATFATVNGGKSVAEGNVKGDTFPLNGVLVPGTELLGFGWNAAVAPPTFHEFPLKSPPECTEETGGCPSGFATLEPNTNPDQVTNGGGQFASQLGGHSGVLGIFNTLFSDSGPLECPGGGFGTAYAYASGEQTTTNNYNKSPEEADSAWKKPITQADCSVDEPAVAGGPSGFGVLENNLAAGDVVYHPFDEANKDFDTPFATIAANVDEEDPAVSQDGAGGIYTTFLLGGGGGPISLAYSSNGGASWTGPATLNANTDGGANEVDSSVGSTGQGWAAWVDGGSVYAQQFDAADATPPVPPPAPDTLTTSQTSGATTGASITIAAGTVGETDRATLSGVNAATATGTVTYSLYSNPTCTAASKVFSGGTVAVAGGVGASSAGVSAALALGTYYWQAVYSGDARNVGSTSACGAELLSVVPASSIEGKGTSTSATVTITVTCASTPCTVTITITIAGPSGKAAAARKKAKHPKIITLATGKFTITAPGSHKLTLRLTKDGKRLFARDHGRLKAKVLIAEKTAGGLETTTRTVSFTPAKTKHKSKK
jgi:hypothetical protein